MEVKINFYRQPQFCSGQPGERELIFIKQPYFNLNRCNIENDLIFLKMEDDLIFFKLRQPHFCIQVEEDFGDPRYQGGIKFFASWEDLF